MDSDTLNAREVFDVVGLMVGMLNREHFTDEMNRNRGYPRSHPARDQFNTYSHYKSVQKGLAIYEQEQKKLLGRTAHRSVETKEVETKYSCCAVCRKTYKEES